MKYIKPMFESSDEVDHQNMLNSIFTIRDVLDKNLDRLLKNFELKYNMNYIHLLNSSNHTILNLEYVRNHSYYLRKMEEGSRLYNDFELYYFKMKFNLTIDNSSHGKMSDIDELSKTLRNTFDNVLVSYTSNSEKINYEITYNLNRYVDLINRGYKKINQ